MEKNKEDAAYDYFEMVRKSWTWARMTTHEHCLISGILCNAKLCGGYMQRYNQCNELYNAFLLGLGYENHKWREPETSEEPLF